MLDYGAAGLSPVENWVPFDGVDRGRRRRLYDIVFTPMGIDERNRHISDFYHRLDLELRAVLPAGNPNWFTFGKWPSRQVAQFLHPEHSWWPVVGHLIGGVGRAMAHGNRLVCLDLGEAFDIWLSTVGMAVEAGGEPWAIRRAWDDCLMQLMHFGPGGANKASVGARFGFNPYSPSFLRATLAFETLAAAREAIEGDDRSAENLILGLECYTAALLAENAATVSQRIFAGNVYLAAHEQQALDEVLSAALRIRHRLSGMNAVRRALAGTPWNTFRKTELEANELLDEDEALVGYTSTITFRLGDVTINVSEPVAGSLPGVLVESFDPRMVGVFELGGDEAAGSEAGGANDWTSWGERVGVIRRLFGVWHVAALDAQWPAAQQSPPSVPALPQAIAALDDREGIDETTDLDSLALASDPPADNAVLKAEEIGHGAALALVADDVAVRIENLRKLNLLDDSALMQGQRFYERLTVCINLCLQFVSMPEDFTGGVGVRLLASDTRQAVHPVRRSAEVGRFLDDVMGTPFWVRGSAGFDDIVGVRTMHAAVRQRMVAKSHETPPTWDSEVLGVPLNQEHLLGTALSFFVPVMETMDRLGVDAHRELRRGYQITWLTIAHLLGVPLEALTSVSDGRLAWLNEAQCTALGELFRHRHRRRTIDGVRLMEGLLEDLEDHMPNDFTWVPVAMMRALAGDETCDLLLVPDVDPVRLALAEGVFWTAAAGPTRGLAKVIQNAVIGSIDAKRPFRAPMKFVERGPKPDRHTLAPSALAAPTAPNGVAEPS